MCKASTQRLRGRSEPFSEGPQEVRPTHVNTNTNTNTNKNHKNNTNNAYDNKCTVTIHIHNYNYNVAVNLAKYYDNSKNPHK